MNVIHILDFVVKPQILFIIRISNMYTHKCKF